MSRSAAASEKPRGAIGQGLVRQRRETGAVQVAALMEPAGLRAIERFARCQESAGSEQSRQTEWLAIKVPRVPAIPVDDPIETTWGKLGHERRRAHEEAGVKKPARPVRRHRRFARPQENGETPGPVRLQGHRQQRFRWFEFQQPATVEPRAQPMAGAEKRFERRFGGPLAEGLLVRFPPRGRGSAARARLQHPIESSWPAPGRGRR